MAELNASWAVLRNPAARAAYDASLAAAGRAAAASADPAGADLVAGAAVLDPEPARTAPARTPGGQPWGCLLVVLGVVVAFAALTAYAASRGDDQVEVRTREPLAEGACVLVGQEGGQTVLVEVACGDPHDAEVVARVRFPSTCPRSTAAVLLPDQVTLVCLQEAAGVAPGLAPRP